MAKLPLLRIALRARNHMLRPRHDLLQDALRDTSKRGNVSVETETYFKRS